MSRDEGFRVADIDVGILDDPKFRALVRTVDDEAVAARCVVAYLATVTASWARGERIALEDAAPLWITGLAGLRVPLVECGLLDRDGRIPEQAWGSWYEPAYTRQQHQRERWAKANANRRKTPRGDSADTSRTPRGYSGDRPLRPSSPTRQSSPPMRASRGKKIDVDSE